MLARWILIGLAGSIVCTYCDHLHATHDVLLYAHPVLGEQGWWVPLLFFVAAIAAVAGAGFTQRALSAEGVHVPDAVGVGRAIAGDSVAFVTAYAFTAFASTLPNVVLGVLVAFWIARVIAMPRWMIPFSLLVALCGCLTEASLSSLGLFHYCHPDVIGVTRWLPGIYLHVAPLAVRVSALVRTTGA